ncbi:MAG: hypothetical protein WAK91_06865 [Candidatus Acidiferrales bacterium]
MAGYVLAYSDLLPGHVEKSSDGVHPPVAGSRDPRTKIGTHVIQNSRI